MVTKQEQLELAKMLHGLVGKLHVLASEAGQVTRILDGIATLNNELVKELHGQEAEAGSVTSE